LICYSWVCHSDWQEQISAEAADAEEPTAVGLGALELDAMELDTGVPDVVEPYAGPEVLC